MAAEWLEWSKFVLKSIERIEKTLQIIFNKIDSVVEKTNNRIESSCKEMDGKLNIKYKELNNKLEKIEIKTNNNNIELTSQKVKVTLLICGCSMLVSALVSFLFTLLK